MKSGLCSICQIVLAEENCRASVVKIGSGYCHECHRKYRREWRKNNPEKYKEQNRKSHATHRLRRVAYQIEYRKTHKEESAITRKKYNETTRGRYRALKTALKKDQVHENDILWNFNFYSEFIKDSRCHYCKGLLSSTGHGLDRIENDKLHISCNVVPCCWDCNNIKGCILNYSEMMLLAPVLREIRKQREVTKEKDHGDRPD